MTKTYQICKRCIMDTTDPDIKFNTNGYCNHCSYTIEYKKPHGLSPLQKQNEYNI